MGEVAGRVMPLPKDNYDSTVIYNKLDMVTYNDKLWMAKKNLLQGIEPSESNRDSWMLCISNKGEDLTALEASINAKFDNVNARIDGVGVNVADLQAKDEEILGTVAEEVNGLQTQITSNANSITALQNGKADKSTTVTTTIPSSGWGSDGPPYANTLTVEGVTETSIVDIVIPGTTTSAEMTAYQEAMILNGSQAKGQVILNAWGVVPIIDLPVTIVIRG